MYVSINLLSQFRLKKKLWATTLPAINQLEIREREAALICRYVKGCPSQNPSARLLQIIHFDIAFPFIAPEHEIPIQQ